MGCDREKEGRKKKKIPRFNSIPGFVMQYEECLYEGWLKGWELSLDSGAGSVKVVTILCQFMRFPLSISHPPTMTIKKQAANSYNLQDSICMAWGYPSKDGKLPAGISENHPDTGSSSVDNLCGRLDILRTLRTESSLITGTEAPRVCMSLP